ncbi:MAG: hypothetical protein NT122_06415 [Solirubrobacterales bacterium]|nr:hypothetical protein [Solirubrobacterales bacterium]
MTRTSKFSALLVLVALAALAPSAAAVPGSDPTAKIGSTKGSGAGGCVTTGKTVVFTLNPTVPYISVRTAVVTLDGKKVVSKSFTTPGIQTFSYPISVRTKAAGAHTIRLTGTFLTIARKSHLPLATASGIFIPTATATATIIKCAAKPKPHFTG